jgi:hypothetical protein
LLIGVGRTSAPRLAAPKAGLDCRRCHEAVWREWDDSYHARSFSDFRVQAAFQHFGHDRKCESCHAPERLLVADPQQPIALRADDREAGVDCLSCHGLPGGRVAASRDIANAPCRPVYEPKLADSVACAACHVAIYKDWLESRYQAEGTSCQTCHMPKATNRDHGRSHRCLGGHDDALVRAGAKFECRREGDELVVTVTNHATGHNFPGERHNRVLLVQVIERDAGGEITLSDQALIKGITPFRGESSEEKIRVDQTFEARFPLPATSVMADVRLLYKPFAWYADRDALVVDHLDIDLTP